jgi:hypothetical protein
MPDTLSHSFAAGLGISYIGAKTFGIDTDYLIIGLMGALLASASEDPVSVSQCDTVVAWWTRARKLGVASAKLCASGFVAALVVAILIHYKPGLDVIGIPIAGLLGFFGQIFIKLVRESLPTVWSVALNWLMAKFSKGETKLDKGDKNV